jgi:hypothetical protein
MPEPIKWTSEDFEILDLAFDDGYTCDECEFLKRTRGTQWEPEWNECGLIEQYKKHPATRCPGYAHYAQIRSEKLADSEGEPE